MLLPGIIVFSQVDLPPRGCVVLGEFRQEIVLAEVAVMVPHDVEDDLHIAAMGFFDDILEAHVGRFITRIDFVEVEA
jgi:hypothetical protein